MIGFNMLSVQAFIYFCVCQPFNKCSFLYFYIVYLTNCFLSCAFHPVSSMLEAKKCYLDNCYDTV